MPKEVYYCNDLNRTDKCPSINMNGCINKLNTSSPDYLPTVKYPHEALQETDGGKTFFQYRYLVALMEFFLFFEINAYRVATSISIVAMVNHSAVSSHKSNVSSESCPLNTSEFTERSAIEMDGEFDWSPSIQGYILGSGFLGCVVTIMPGGLLAEVYGAKRVLLSGLLISSLAHLLSPFAAWLSSHCMVVIQLLRGLGQGLLPASRCVLAANWYPKSERGQLNSFILTGYSVGALIGGVTSGALCSSTLFGGWPSVYYIYGGLGLVFCLCFQLFLYESPKVHPRISHAELTYILHDQETKNLSQKRPPTPWKKIFTSVPVYALTYAIFAQLWMGAHFLSVQPIFLETILHFSIKENGLFTSIPFIFQTLSSFVGGWISKWLNAHNYVGVNKARKGSNFICCLVYSLCFLGVCYVGCDRAMSNFLSITGISFIGFAYSGCMITANDMSPTYAGTLMGLASSIGSIAAFIFPIIVGAMTDEAQTLEQWNKIFMLCIAVAMSSGIIFCVFGSAEVQPWNFSSEDEIEKNSTSSSKEKKEVGEPQKPVEAVTHM